MRTTFFEEVHEVVKQIPFGRVTSYGAIAKFLGANKSARMVGYALNQCAGRGDIPAHRVVNRKGMLTGRHHFPEDRPMDQLLIQEGVEIEQMQVKYFEKHYWDPGKELV